MFDPAATPRVFALPPGVDFPAALIAGLRERLTGQPPEAIARVDLIVNTRRMARRLRDIFDAGPPSLLPRIRLLTDLDGFAPELRLPPGIPPLRRRLELIQLISRLLDSDPPPAARSSLYALADSLAGLMDEMQGEGVSPDVIANLDVSDFSEHWALAQQFLQIAQTYLARVGEGADAEARQRLMVTGLLQKWEVHPPQHPIILAGSTGSRGTTAMLMQAIARLPQGAVVLPGFDMDLPTAVWADLDKPLLSEDHPQYRFGQLMKGLALSRKDIMPWHDTPAPSPARNRLMSLALRPAPVTHAWLSEGPALSDFGAATGAITLVEAPTPRIEALAIAMRLRQAVEMGQKAALITPDRMLTRQVTAALDRWNILPDDSAGTPLHLSPPGRFLRHVSTLFLRALDAEALLTLLKHPLTHSATGRNLHQLHTQRLEGAIRRYGLPFPDAQNLMPIAERAAAKIEEPEPFLTWARWVAGTFCGHDTADTFALSDWVERHLALAVTIAAGPEGDTNNELWKQNAGIKARSVMESLQAEAPHGGALSGHDYASLLTALLQSEVVRDRDAPHPDVMIWGTLEARVQGADLVILGGLNDGTWPEAPPPDPWLNRQMRLRAGLLLPERRIGLSAHDFQQAIAAPEVWLSRAIRSDEAETVPSRWLNRLGNLMQGLSKPDAQDAWDQMLARGNHWLDQARALEAVTPVDPAPRPSPRPPISARPRGLSVTEIQRLIRDPYAIYARHTLELRPVNPLVQTPDAPVRGIVVHAIMERFIKDITADPALLTREHLISITQSVLEAEAPWPAARMMWLARIERIADWFIEREGARQATATPVAFEKDARGTHQFPELGFTLTGYADRIDRTDAGNAALYDYKTGTPPGKKEQQFFDKQLLIEAAMVEEGGFDQVGAIPVSEATFIGLGSNPKEVPAPLQEEPPAQVLAGLRSLIAQYLDPEQGFTSRRIIKSDRYAGDYDQLARYGEWDGTNLPTPEDLA